MEQEQEDVQDVSDLEGGSVIWKDPGDCSSLLHPQERIKEDTLPMMLVFLVLMVKDLVWAQEHIRDTADYGATALQLLTYQVTLQQHNNSLAILSGNQKSTNVQCNGHL